MLPQYIIKGTNFFSAEHLEPILIQPSHSQLKLSPLHSCRKLQNIDHMKGFHVSGEEGCIVGDQYDVGYESFVHVAITCGRLSELARDVGSGNKTVIKTAKDCVLV